MATTTTPNLGLTLAVPGSNEPFDTAVVNANFEAIDDEVGSQRADSTTTDTRLDTIEKFTNPTVPSPTMGISPAGTSAQRDGLYGVPADAAARVALANKYPRWFSTEKGYEQQYFAAFDDAGVSATTPVKPTAGWAPSLQEGLVPLSAFTVVVSAGTVTKKGTRVEYTTASNLELRGVFDSAFEDFEIVVENEAGPASGDGTFQFLAGSVPYTGAGYGSNRTVTAASGTVTGAYNAAGQGVMYQTGAQHGWRTRVINPNVAKTTFWLGEGYTANGISIKANGHVGNDVWDGIKFLGAGFTGRLNVYGVAK